VSVKGTAAGTRGLGVSFAGVSHTFPITVVAMAARPAPTPRAAAGSTLPSPTATRSARSFTAGDRASARRLGANESP
jgi:hypothetical protein